MNSICLSVAPNLRCQGLSKLEHIVLVIPPTIELVFSFTLAVSGASLDGRKRWLLVIDGLSFFLLALTDFLAQVIPEAASTRHVFALLDTFVAAASFLPILFYTFFLFLFARASLVTYLPTRFSRITTLSLLAIIPPTLVSNELGSLLGLTHTVFSISNHAPIVAAGSSTPVLQRLSQFFSATTLALLTVFQALLFVLAFVRVVRGFLDERSIEASKHDPHVHEKIHLFRGLGWFAGGLKLGAIETVVGFANISFAVVVARRILRLFARGTLIIGVIKGLNVVEDFHAVESDLRARSTRRPKRTSRYMISNPRNSTFRDLSPNASGFHESQRTKRARVGPSPLALGGASNHAAFESKSNLIPWDSPGFDATSPEFNAFDNPRATDRKTERVTVHYNGKTPPVLQLRFSRVDMNMHPHPPSLPNASHGHNNGHSHHHAAEKSPLPLVVEDLREDNVSVSLSLSDRDRDWDRQLFYPGYVPRTAPAPSTPRAPARRPTRDPRRASLARSEPSLSTDVPMPLPDTIQKQEQVLLRSSHDSRRRSPVRSSGLAQDTPRPSQEIPRASQETQDVRPGLGVTTRSTRTMSAASDSLEAVREIAARFPRLPPRVVGKPSSSLRHTNAITRSGAGDAYTPPPGLHDDADSDSEWRTLARARSLQRRREREREAGAVSGISPVNSIKRKLAPSSIDERVDTANAGEELEKGRVAQAIIARAALTARAARSAHGHGYAPSLDDDSSVYSSDDDGSDGGKYSYMARNTDTTELTSVLGTPATTAAVATPGLGTPTSWARGDQRSMGGIPGRVMVVEGAKDLPQSKVQMPPYTQMQPKHQPKQLPPREEAAEGSRRRRLTLLRRELRASAHDSAAASATLDPELQAPWLHADPLTQLQTIGTGTLYVDGEDEDTVLDEAWRRAGLTRIKSVSHVRVHTTPRAEQGIEIRESLVAEEEEDLGLLVTPVEIQELNRERRASVSASLRKPARLDSGVLGEEDRRLVRQGIRA